LILYFNFRGVYYSFIEYFIVHSLFYRAGIFQDSEFSTSVGSGEGSKESVRELGGQEESGCKESEREEGGREEREEGGREEREEGGCEEREEGGREECRNGMCRKVFSEERRRYVLLRMRYYALLEEQEERISATKRGQWVSEHTEQPWKHNSVSLYIYKNNSDIWFYIITSVNLGAILSKTFGPMGGGSSNGGRPRMGGGGPLNRTFTSEYFWQIFCVSASEDTHPSPSTKYVAFRTKCIAIGRGGGVIQMDDVG